MIAKKVVIIDDNIQDATITKNCIEDSAVQDNIECEIVLLTTPNDILAFLPSDEDLIIVDSHLFDNFNCKTAIEDNFPSGTMLAEKFKKNNFKGKIIVYSGDEDMVMSKNSSGLFGFFKKNKSDVAYAVKGSMEGFQKILDTMIRK